MNFKVIKLQRWYGYFLVLGIFLALLIYTGKTFSTGKAAVTLLYFTATGGNNQVTLNWATATELNNVGFFVGRSSQRDGAYTRVNTDIIPAQGDGFTGSTYEYVDNGVSNGAQYWYRLESIDSGQQSTFSDPVNVTVGSASTPTLTATSTATGSGIATATRTQTPTPTNIGTTPVPTSTRTPTQANFSQTFPTSTIPPIPTITQSAPNSEPTQDPGAPVGSTPEAAAGVLSTPLQNDLPGDSTATFVPFPTVTIQFPATPNTSAPLPRWDAVSGPLDLKSLSGLWPLGLVILIWIALGAWFYFTHRHFH